MPLELKTLNRKRVSKLMDAGEVGRLCTHKYGGSKHRLTLAPTGVFFLGLKVLAVFLQSKEVMLR